MLIVQENTTRSLALVNLITVVTLLLDMPKLGRYRETWYVRFWNYLLFY